MKTELTVAKIGQGLENNLRALQSAAVERYLSFPEYCQRQPRYKWETEQCRREMEEQTNRICILADHLETTLPSLAVAALETKIADGISQSLADLRSWQYRDPKYEKMGFFDRLQYPFSPAVKTKVEGRLKDHLRSILSYEAYLDSQIILQHTEEFGEAFQKLGERTRQVVRNSLVGGYHAQGFIIAGVMRGIKQQCGITVEYNRMSEAVAH